MKQNKNRPVILNEHDEYDHRDLISEALWRFDYAAYASGEGPLLVEELPEELTSSEEFEEFIELFGWPDVSDGAIEPLYPEERDFDSEAASDFLVRFLSLNQHDPSRNLNNFSRFLVSTPHTHSFIHSPSLAMDMYGTHPVLHRLYVLMPELMESLKVLLSDMEDRYDGNRNDIGEELSIPMNDEIVKAIMLVYEIAGRFKSRRHASSAANTVSGW